LLGKADARSVRRAIDEALAGDSATVNVALAADGRGRQFDCTLSSLSLRGETRVVCLCQEFEREQLRDQVQTEQRQRYESLLQ
jgi:hypothetical protein